MKIPRLLPNLKTANSSFDEMVKKLEQYTESCDEPNPSKVYWIVFLYSMKSFILIASLLSLIIVGNVISDGPALLSMWFGAIIIYMLYGVGKATYNTAQDLVLNPQGNAWGGEYDDKKDTGE
jgi:hypothetical protein